MAKPTIRLGASVSEETWKTLLKVDDFEGITPLSFFIETGHPTVWLVYAGEDESVFSRLHEITTKRGPLPMKSAGEWREWDEVSRAHFGAAVDVASAELVMTSLESSSDSDSSTLGAARDSLSAARRKQIDLRSALDAAITRDAATVARHREFERENSARLGSSDH